jgi:ferredoxin
MRKRKIIKINEAKCNGCGLCIPNCPEGAIQIIDGKARLISDLFCDGLGACIGHCPQGAITVEEREAQEYDERKVMANIVKQGKNVIRAHLEHLKEHNQKEYLKEALDYLREKEIKNPLEESISQEHRHEATFSGCSGSKIMDFRSREETPQNEKVASQQESELKTWPVQIMLVPPFAPYLNNADLLIAADCVPFAYAGFHEDLLKGRVLLVGCPKLDDTQVYGEKIIQLLKQNTIKAITYAHMEVPCCFELVSLIKEAIAQSGKNIPFKEVIISIKGEKIK